MEGLRGQVVLIDFWTYTCINCIRTFPHLKAWDDELPRRRPDDRRRPRPRVPVRARRRQRLRRDRPERDRVPGRPGQRHRHLERLRQPVLAGQVPDRRRGPGPLRPLRRGRLRRDRGRDPHPPAREGRLRARRRRLEGEGRGGQPRRSAPPRPTWARSAPRAGRTAAILPGDRRASASPRRRSPRTSSPSRATGRSPRRGLVGRERRRDQRQLRRREGLPRPRLTRRTRATSRSCSTASRSRTTSPARTSGTASRRSAPSASTAWSTSRRPAATSSSCASSRGSTATRSRSASRARGLTACGCADSTRL